MRRRVFMSVLLMVSAIPVLAFSHTGKANVVDVRIVSDRGGEFAKYRTYPRVRQEGSFFYVEAVKGDRYSIQVANRNLSLFLSSLYCAAEDMEAVIFVGDIAVPPPVHKDIF